MKIDGQQSTALCSDGIWRRLTDVRCMSTFVLEMRTERPQSRAGSEPATLLFGRTRGRVLGLLLGHADEAYYLREVARLTGAGLGAVQRELGQLTAAGLLQRTVRGRQVYFQANRDAPVFPELRSIFAKTVGLADVLRQALAPLMDRAAVAFVFGSAARGGMRAGSDIDLLIVGDVDFATVVAALAPAQERLGRDVNPSVYPPAEFRDKIEHRQHFLTSVLREPRLFIIGGDDELVGVGAKRLGGAAPDEPSRDPRPAEGRRTRPRR